MPVLPTGNEYESICAVKKFFIDKLGPIKPPMQRIKVLNWINLLSSGKAATKIGRINGYRDQWLIGAYYNEFSGTIELSFCQGRNVGRIVLQGGYTVHLDIRDCVDDGDIEFKFIALGYSFKDTRKIISDLTKIFDKAIQNNDHESIRRCIRRFQWLQYDLNVKIGGTKMGLENEIAVMKEKVEIALKQGATPSLKICEELRATDPSNAKWLDDKYMEYRRPELVGDDKDGLTALLKSEGFLRRAIEKCQKTEVVYWMRIIKGLDPLPDSVRDGLIEQFQDTGGTK